MNTEERTQKAAEAIQRVFQESEKAIQRAEQEAARKVAEITQAADELAAARREYSDIAQALAPLRDKMLDAQLRGDQGAVDELRRRFARLTAQRADADLRVAEATRRYEDIQQEPHLVWSSAAHKVEAIEKEARTIRDQLLEAVESAFSKHVEAAAAKVHKQCNQAHERYRWHRERQGAA